MNTQFIIKPMKKAAHKHRKSLIGGGSLGLSAAAVIWMYHTFVPLDFYNKDQSLQQHQYDKDQTAQQEQNSLLWHELHSIEQPENKPKGKK